MKLLHLQRPPPVSALQSRIRSAARDLPQHRLSIAIVLAMVDFLHDRLQLVRKHESSWAFVRPALLQFLKASDYPDIDNYYNDSPASSTVAWKPIHPGQLQMHPAVVDEVLKKPSQSTEPAHRAARSTAPSPPMDQCVFNLASEGVISPLERASDPTLSLFLKPKDETTARIICDLRPLNSMYDRKPPRFHLPSTALLLHSTRWWQRSFFTKMDVNAYFHSLSLGKADLNRLLPTGFTGDPFVFSYRGRAWSWRRLPFGWSWAPCLAQRQMELLVSEVMVDFPMVLWLVYYDDLLLAAEDPDILSHATRACLGHLLSRNLKLSLHKCSLNPAERIEWIGKEIAHQQVHNTSTRTRQLAGFLVALGNCRRQRLLRRLIGWLSWFCSHFPGATRCMQPLYQLLYADLADGLPWWALWSSALAVTLGCVKVQWPTRSSLSILYCDACAAKGTVGVCEPLGLEGVTTSIPSELLAEYRTASFAQQTAELYGVTVSVALAALEETNLLLLTDSSACVGWFSGLKIPPNKQQGRLLLAAAVLQTLYGATATLRWVPGELNPADRWSRSELHEHGP